MVGEASGDGFFRGRGDEPGGRGCGRLWLVTLPAGDRGSPRGAPPPSGRATTPPDSRRLHGGGPECRGRRPKVRCDGAWRPPGSWTTPQRAAPQFRCPGTASSYVYAELCINVIMRSSALCGAAGESAGISASGMPAAPHNLVTGDQGSPTICRLSCVGGSYSPVPRFAPALGVSCPDSLPRTGALFLKTRVRATRR